MATIIQKRKIDSLPELREGALNGDRLSLLPTEILLTIISLLSIKDAARITVLSSRWRHLWPVTPRNFDDSSLIPLRTSASLTDEDHRCIAIISRLLNLSPSDPIQSFTLSRFPLKIINHIIHGWFETLAQRNLEQFTLRDYSPRPRYPLPSCSLFNSCSLRTLHIAGLKILPQTIMCFPNLRVLVLEEIFLVEESLVGLVSNCPTLEDLQVVRCLGLANIRISSSQSLRAFSVKISLIFQGGYPQEVIVEDAPNLERLMLCQRASNRDVKILNSPKLKVFGFINANHEPPKLGNSLKGKKGNKIPRSLRLSGSSFVKTLGIVVDCRCLGQRMMTCNLLKCFPCLETLDLLFVTMRRWMEFKTHYWDREDCPNLKLKSINLDAHLKNDSEVNFIKLLFGKSRRLKVMTIYCRSDESTQQAQSIRDNADKFHKNGASIEVKLVPFTDNHFNHGSSTWESLKGPTEIW